jgi:hypothetical protein
MKTRVCLVLAAAACFTGCGKEERMEAVRLAKVLKEEQATFARANKIEDDFVTNARAWCGGITTGGAGRGVELDQNAAVATELAKSVVAAGAELGRIRQAVSAPSLTKQDLQDVRGTLITRLTARQRQLQDLRVLLEQSALQFQQYRKDKAYAGDSYPGEIAKLNAFLTAYKGPEDAVGAALTDLKTKYHLADSEF